MFVSRQHIKGTWLIISLHRFGLEGLITFKRENRYDPDNYEIFVPHDPSNPNSPEAKIGVFDKVTVEITVEKVSKVLIYVEY